MDDILKDMPNVIYAYKSTKGVNVKTKETVDIGYHGTGTWIDVDDSCPEDAATQYIRADLAALAPVDIEGLKQEVENAALDHKIKIFNLQDIHTVIDYITARGCFGVPEGYILYSKKNYERADAMFRFLNEKKMVQEFNQWRAAPKKEG